ncbi:replication initiator protein A [Variovorax paradoxus]|nr:replication initiator protein A [Variovorax paradoxus]
MAKNDSAESSQDPAAEDDFGQGDLFACDIRSWPVKDDLASMEIPIFSLAKQKDLSTREYRRRNKTASIRPGADGAATVFDKDLLLYVASQIVEAPNQGRPTSRIVRVDSIDFLTGTARGDGRASFERILDMLRRLAGTRTETSYKILAERRRQVSELHTRTGRTPSSVSARRGCSTEPGAV